MKYKEYIITSCILFLICLLLFHKVLFSPYHFLGPDSLSPKAVQQGIQVAEDSFGEYPLWLPWVFSGLPSVHSFQNISDYYYPYKIFKAFNNIGLPRFYEFIFHYVFAGLGLFVLLKYLRCNFFSSLFGSISYMSMAYLITMIVHGHGSQMMTAAYIPWIIFALMYLFDTQTIKAVGLLGLLLGLQLQRSHVQIAYYTWMMIGLYMLMYVIRMLYDKKDRVLSVKPLLATFGSLFLGIGMATSIYFPAISYTPFSIRGSGLDGGAGLQYATQWSFHPLETLTFLIPSFFGFGGLTYWGQMPFTDYPNYMGLIVLILAIYGYIKTNHSIKYFLLISLIFSLLISFGHHFSSFFNLIYYYFPLFNKFRVPVMILVILQFCICILAGIGLNQLGENISKNKFNILNNIFSKIILFISFAIVIIFYAKNALLSSSVKSHPVLNPERISMITVDFYNSLIILFILLLIVYLYLKDLVPKKFLYISIIILSFVDTSIINNKIMYPEESKYMSGTLTHKQYLEAYLKTDGVMNFLMNDTTKFRILSISPELNRSNRWSAFNIENVGGYHPAKLSNYSNMMNLSGSSRQGFWQPSPAVMKMLNIKYLISLNEISHEDLKLVFSGSIYLENKKNYSTAHVYKYKNYYERFYFSESISNIKDEHLIANLNDYYFEPKSNAMLSENLPDIEYDKNATIKLIKWSPNEIIFETQAESKQFLNISEVFYPEGWFVNGSDKIYEVNNLIRGIIVDSGKNKYHMKYEPKEVVLGSLISGFSFFILCFFILLGNRNEN